MPDLPAFAKAMAGKRGVTKTVANKELHHHNKKRKIYNKKRADHLGPPFGSVNRSNVLLSASSFYDTTPIVHDKTFFCLDVLHPEHPTITEVLHGQNVQELPFFCHLDIGSSPFFFFLSHENEHRKKDECRQKANTKGPI